MPDAEVDRWPRLQLVTFTAPTTISHGWDAELLSQEVPTSFIGHAFHAANEQGVLATPEDGQFICFGTTGLFGKMCLDPRSGAVVEIACAPARGADRVGTVVGHPDFVNSSVAQFTASVRAVFARFPFDSGHTEDDQDGGSCAEDWARADKLDQEWDQAVEDLTEVLRRIDPAAMADEDTYWRTFLDGEQMGDFETSKILGNRANSSR
jgi:hypothetical protein